jgi:hypothetical protein
MKFTIIATIFAALATTGYSAAADAAADAIPVVAAVDDTAPPQGIMTDGSDNHRVLRGKKPADAAANDESPEGEAPDMEGTGKKRVLGTKNGANEKDYSDQNCSLCCDDDFHC